MHTITPDTTPAHPVTGAREAHTGCVRVTPREPLAMSDAAGMQDLRRAGARAVGGTLKNIGQSFTMTPGRAGVAYVTVWAPVERRPLEPSGVNRARAAGHLARTGHALVAHLEPSGTAGVWDVVRECCPIA